MKNSIKVERAKLNITQGDLADRLGVTRQTINAIELGKYAPSALLLLKMAVIFKCSVHDFVSLEASDWEEA